MNEELDPGLLRAFVAAPSPAADAAFVAALLRRVARARRVRFAARLASAALVLAIAAFIAPVVADATGELLGTLNLFVVSPLGVVVALLVATAAWWRTWREVRA